MERIGRNVSDALAIEVENVQVRYLAGDIILGRVVRRSHTVNPAGRVTIRLLGRLTSATHLNSNSAKSYGGCDLFDYEQLEDVLYDGPIHVAPKGDSASWPFAIAIPRHPNARSVLAGNLRGTAFLSLKLEDIAQHPLPPSCDFLGLGEGYVGYVEYWLKATIILKGTTSSMDESIFPIQLGTPPGPTLFTDFGLMETITMRRSVDTLRLIPGMEDAKLSMKQKARTFFGSSKVPTYMFRAQVSVPSVVQLGHASPIPFCVRAVPASDGCSEIIREVPQTITLESFELKIKPFGEVICGGTVFMGSLYTGSDNNGIDLRLKDIFDRLKRQGPIVVPQGEDAEPLDIGQHLELRLDKDFVYAFGRAVRGITLSPSMATYNLRSTWRLFWSLTFKVAGEECTATGSQSVRLLAASGDGEAADQPSATAQEEEALPAYDGARDGNYAADTLPSYREAAEDGGQSSRAVDSAGIVEPRVDVKGSQQED